MATRDYSGFLPSARPPGPGAPPLLQVLGWQPFLARQTSAEEMERAPPVRVIGVQRSGLQALGAAGEVLLPPRADTTVGDWLMVEPAAPGQARLLDRKSLLTRRAPGTDRRLQPIAANLDTAFVVTSCNRDFNVARLERYLALAFEAGIEPVIVLTKPDLSETPEDYAAAAQAISDRVPVVMLDARGPAAVEVLAPWCRTGRSAAFLGSSGVGKSTLINALGAARTVATAAVREDDARGRHTTTSRELHILPRGWTVLDTPGMRELQLADAAEGVAEVFADLADLAARCRFRDCAHQGEPGCAVAAAVEAGMVDADRLARWRKLDAEERHNTASLAERRSRDKALGRTIKAILKQSRK